jgi:release factor glutamine methyltransferase
LEEELDKTKDKILMTNHQKHLQVKTIDEVYPPGEDTWFLSDILVNFILENSKKDSASKTEKLVCEVGVGSGYISILLSLKFPEMKIFCTDISPLAVSLSYKNALHLVPKGKLFFCCSNLLNCFNSSKFDADIIFFNPPYVRTPLPEINIPLSPIVRTWAGGPDGIHLIDKFLEELLNFRFKQAFFLSSSINDNDIFLEAYTSQLEIDEFNRKRIEDEQLICYRVNKL